MLLSLLAILFIQQNSTVLAALNLEWPAWKVYSLHSQPNLASSLLTTRAVTSCKSPWFGPVFGEQCNDLYEQ